MELSKTVWGVDIGVASCGLGVVESQDMLVRKAVSLLFPCANAENNGTRRAQRQHRRLLRRQKTRIADFDKLWSKTGLQSGAADDNDIVGMRVRALSEKVSASEIYAILRTELKHRGISYLDEDDDIAKKGGDYAKGIAINQEELKTKYPCQIQQDRLNKYGQYRGENVVMIDGERVALSNIFTTSAYQKEIAKILEIQKQYHEFIDDGFIKAYLEIFSRKRKYYHGPGNALSRTNYGRYTAKIGADGKYITMDNIFENLIGKCSVYPNELRASGASYTAQEFNFLNDMNNLTIGNRKLSEDEKKNIRELILSADKCGASNIEKFIAKVTGEDITTLKGYRIDKDNKHLYHCFEIYRTMVKAFAEAGYDYTSYPVSTMDTLAHILTINTERDGILEALAEAKLEIPADELEIILKVRKNNAKQYSKWQSLSLKAMQDLIPTMWEEPIEQMTLLTNLGLAKSKKEIFKGLKYVPANEILAEIYNPVVCRSVRTAIKGINALIKEYGYPEQIVIEMPRDKNDDEEKKRIKDEQGKNEKELEEILKSIKNEYGRSIGESDFYKQKGLVLRLKLWKEQNGRCLYSGKPIDINDLIDHSDMFEVDHALPISISFDDSRNNKVLVYRSENQDKGNETPYMYLSRRAGNFGFNEYKALVKEMNVSQKKKQNLLYTEDITKISVVQGFIARNLNDTRYASRILLNTLQAFFDANEVGTKVKVIRGSATSLMRKNMKLDKNRDESYSHHAVDACLIAYSQMGYDAYQKLQGRFIDFETGEILDKRMWDENMSEDVFKQYLYGQKWSEIRKGLTEAEKHVGYWYKVDKRPNKMLSNLTIYGTRQVDGKAVKISKIKDIRTKDGYEAFKKHKDELLCKKNDIKTYEKLLAICDMYKDAKNPFVAYEEDGNVVTKYAKKNNGPKIVSLKYEDGEVNSCIDISHKYGFEKGSKRVIYASLNPYRMDVYRNHETGKYYLIGVKYADIKCVKNGYAVDEEMYARTLSSDPSFKGILKEGMTRKDLPGLGIEYVMSFYPDELIEYEKDGITCKERFLSRTMPAQVNYIETKPIDAPKFSKQHMIGLSKTTRIRKIRTDMLGNEYYCDKEKWQDIF